LRVVEEKDGLNVPGDRFNPLRSAFEEGAAEAGVTNAMTSKNNGKRQIRPKPMMTLARVLRMTVLIHA